MNSLEPAVFLLTSAVPIRQLIRALPHAKGPTPL